MFRKIFWINIGLFVIVLLLSYNFYKIWSQVVTQIKTPPVVIELAEKPERALQEEEEEPDYMPSSRMSYSPIVEKDLFRPEREEWQPPPPVEEDELDIKQSSPYPQYPGQPAQQEMKRPTVYGIIIIGEFRKYAILQGWTRAEQKERTRKIRLGNGQIREVPLPSLPGKIEQDKIHAYRIGDYISEAQVVDIHPDKVVFEEDDGERYEILLREPSKLELWKPSVADGQTPGQQFPGGTLPGGRPYPIPPGIPYPIPYVPAYPIPPPGYVPPGAIPPQVRGVPAPQQRPLPPGTPQQQQRVFPSRPGFPPGGLPYPPMQTYPGLRR